MPSKYCNLLIMLDRFMLFLDVPNLIRNIVPVRWPVFASHLSLIVVQHLRNWSFFSTYKTAQVPFPGEAISQSHILLRLESLTICHLILHLRQVHLADGSSSTDSRLRSTFLRFASNVVGNLGAPLELDREFDVESEPDDFRPRSSDNPLADSLAHAPNVSSMRNVEPSRYAIVNALFFWSALSSLPFVGPRQHRRSSLMKLSTTSSMAVAGCLCSGVPRAKDCRTKTRASRGLEVVWSCQRDIGMGTISPESPPHRPHRPQGMLYYRLIENVFLHAVSNTLFIIDYTYTAALTSFRQKL